MSGLLIFIPSRSLSSAGSQAIAHYLLSVKMCIFGKNMRFYGGKCVKYRVLKSENVQNSAFYQSKT
jgi:hypothetical protein